MSTIEHNAPYQVNTYFIGHGSGIVKPFQTKYAAVRIAALQNYVSSEAFNNNCFHWLIKLDWANSAPTYPQTGHHSRHRF